MKAIRFARPDAEPRIGVLDGETVRDAGPAGPQGFVPTQRRGRRSTPRAARPAVDEVALAPGRPAQALCIGLNYRDHAEESELDIPAVPVIFAKWTTSLIGQGETIVIPREETRPDYEGELAVVIGEPVYRATGDEARAAVGGTRAPRRLRAAGRSSRRRCGSSRTARASTRSARSVPRSSIARGRRPRRRAGHDLVSGETMQDSSTSNLIFGIQALVEYVSLGHDARARRRDRDRYAGRRRRLAQPPRYLREGDMAEIEVGGVGTLRNGVRMEA